MSLPGLSSLLPLPVAVPLGVATFCPIAARIWRRLPLIACLLALGASSAILLAMAPTVYGGHLLAHFMGHVLPVHGKALGIAFAADPWGLSFALVSSLVGMVILVYAVSELRGLGAKEEGWFACLFLLLDVALIGSALTADVINLFVWFEVAALASYALTGFFLERPIALEASFKVLVLTNIASFAIFIGATLLYAGTGGLDFGQLQQALVHHVTRPELVVLALLVGGFATKAGLLPFHGWLPDAHTAAPGSVSALFSGLMVNLGIVAIGRIVFEVFLPAGGKPVLGLLMEAPQERDEPLRPGMIIGLGVLAAACVAFGVIYGVLLPHVMAKAAGALLHPPTYARDVLRSGGWLVAARVRFSYFDPVDLGTVALTIVAAIPLARFAMRTEADDPVHRILAVMRRIQNGSVNDYTSYLVVGFLVAAGSLVLG